METITRRGLLGGIAGLSALTALSGLTGCASAIEAAANSCPTDPALSGGVTWPPDIAHPVFYGFQDLAKADGPPRDLLIYYPSVDGSPQNAQILELCLTAWPVVYFLHGQPPSGVSFSGYHRKWASFAAAIARSGYVVVMPNHPANLPAQDYGPIVDAVIADLTWVTTQWSNAKWVDSRLPSTVVGGHSYGALIASRVAKTHPDLAGFVSLSGGFIELPDPRTAPQVNPPSFFMWATGDPLGAAFEDLDTGVHIWDGLTQWRYAAHFPGEHFDYLRAADSGGAPRGDCPLIGPLAADLTALFVAENLPTPLSRTHVSVDLQPPQPDPPLTTEQQFYVGGHLSGYAQFGSTANCRLDMRWDYDTKRGMRTLGH